MDVKDIEVVAVAAYYLYTVYKYYKLVHENNARTNNVKTLQGKLKRRCWARKIHRNRTRQTMNKVLSTLLTHTSKEFNNFVRMSCIDFECILQKISPIIAKKDTSWREAIPTKIRLALTLRFLATGESYRSLHELFKISTSLISRIVPEVCLALNQALEDMIQLPENSEKWLAKAQGVPFPHGLAAIDGKHITMLSKIIGPEYLNHKGSYSIVLVTLIDTDYCFLYADIIQGRIIEDILKHCDLGKVISEGSLKLPPNCQLPESDTNMPYVFLGDKGFKLRDYVMTPIPGLHASGTPERTYNQQLLRSRNTVDNTFGMLSSVFKVFRKPIPLDVEKTCAITLSCVMLHNFLRKSESSRHIYNPQGYTDTYDEDGNMVGLGKRLQSKENLLPLELVTCEPTEDSVQIRDSFMNIIHQKQIQNSCQMSEDE